MMYDYTRIRLCDQPERLDEAADWFAQRWGIAESAYRQSMQESLRPRDAVPQWYLVLTPQGRIAAGAGVIENDFHERRDLAPNVCALFVEPEDRGRGNRRLPAGGHPPGYGPGRLWTALSIDGSYRIL